VVTGANRGIGFEVCRQLAGRGIHVILTSRDEGKGKSVQADLQVLQRFGLVRFEQRRSKSGRTTKAPRAPYGELVFRIAI